MKDSGNQEIDLSSAKEIVNKFSGTKKRLSSELLLPLLKDVEDAYGYLPVPVLSWISRKAGIPASRIYGIITSYSRFSTEPKGKYNIRCCKGSACQVRGGKKAADAVKSSIGIDDGETSKDMLFSFETVTCLGACALAPVMVVNTDYYGKVTSGRAENILKQISGREADG